MVSRAPFIMYFWHCVPAHCSYWIYLRRSQNASDNYVFESINLQCHIGTVTTRRGGEGREDESGVWRREELNEAFAHCCHAALTCDHVISYTATVHTPPILACENVGMGGAPIGAGGHDPTFRGKGDGVHNSEIIHISHIALITLLQ